MSYDLAAVADALADALEAGFDGLVKVHPRPVRTFNVPAVIVGWPEVVEPNLVAPGLDHVRLPVLVAVGLDDTDTLSGLLTEARDALYKDRTLAGAAAKVVVAEYRNFRTINVAGADFLGAELLVDLNT